jgi:hypothetical protein
VDGNRSALGIDNISITALTAPPPGVGGGSSFSEPVSIESEVNADRASTFDAALAGLIQPMHSIAPASNVRSRVWSPIASLPSDHVRLLALQPRVEERRGWDETSELDDRRQEGGAELAERDELFAELEHSSSEVFE